MKSKMKILYIAVVAALLVLIAILLVLLLGTKPRRNNGVPLLRFAQGDTLQGYVVADELGNELDIGDIPGGYRLALFAMDGCADCAAEYSSYQLLFAAYDTSALNVFFVWDDTIPLSDKRLSSIAPGNSYTAQNRYKFTDWVPTAMLIGPGNQILLKTDDMGEMVETLASKINADLASVAKHLEERPLLLGIDRCSGCKSARESLETAGEDFVYTLQNTAENPGKEVLYDPHGILSAALGVDQYPTLARFADGKVYFIQPGELASAE